jgi:hypothetical protein
MRNANSKKNKRTFSSDTLSCKNRKFNGRGERPVKFSTKRETIGSFEKQTLDIGRDGPKEMPGSSVIIKKSKKEDFTRNDKNIVTLINKKNNFLKNDQIQLSQDFLSGSFCGSLRTPKEIYKQKIFKNNSNTIHKGQDPAYQSQVNPLAIATNENFITDKGLFTKKLSPRQTKNDAEKIRPAKSCQMIT